jgi:bifunctional non-homologous end joining protein LigD
LNHRGGASLGAFSPMLATPWPAPFDDDEWVFELKWDGVRCIASSAGHGGLRLRSRRGIDMTTRYPELAGVEIREGLALDGEIVALDENGHPSFERLQGRMNRVPGVGETTVPITYVVFDLVADGVSLLRVPLEERTGRLSSLPLPTPIVIADRFPEQSGGLWSFVVEHDLEGIVAKRLGSVYQPGVRSPDWRKIGNFKQLRAVVGGFTKGTGGRMGTFGALLLGLYDGAMLRWIGAVGSGFDDRALRAIRAALDEMTVSESPFEPDPELPRGARWVQPRLVAMVRYKQWTAAGRVRAPSFLGFTDDAVESVTWDSEGPAASADA